MHYIKVDFSQQSELVVSPNSLNQKNSVDNYLDLSRFDRYTLLRVTCDTFA